jgi:predicted nucleotide-binding protein
MKNLLDIKDFDLPHLKQDLQGLVAKEKAAKESLLPPSNRVFIVHGRDYESVKELKTMLVEFGLNPVVLHEQPSKGRTVVEKLEDYSDVGYAFAVLTPDDVGLSNEEVRKLLSDATGKDNFTVEDLRTLYETNEARTAIAVIQFFSLVKQRARQNVVMEFGYFWGLLGRDRVCCMYKGDVELPSDMHGIVYIPFKKSVNEARSTIIKELRAAGYQIEVR